MNMQELIVLKARPSDSLNWDLDAISEHQRILWAFDLGLEDPYFPLDDELQFQALSMGLSKFSKEVWPLFQERTIGAILYRGRFDFSIGFSWTERQKQNWEVWKKERREGDESHLKRLFCADAFSHYFQMLAHRLPDEMALYLLFDARGVGSFAEKHQILSRERFEHFTTAVKGLSSWNGLIWDGDSIFPSPEAPIAICLPEESLSNGSILAKLDRQMHRLQTPFRVIPEAFLTEEWEGVDQLYVLKEALSPRGGRKLKGFEAAGGTVIEVSDDTI